ncbi:PREDICTED: uncharacterized protein LOC109216868 [Nicotiana attenuata]|uniref:uncharacterized protein LOC109216868 n=1 Tax=Nicotiana attenuata TaxID=49451 RepID=UPI000905C97A|nr:PREDICTED: uncharacterized protein LOC109216868 [Nicotiana attenuata]
MRLRPTGNLFLGAFLKAKLRAKNEGGDQSNRKAAIEARALIIGPLGLIQSGSYNELMGADRGQLLTYSLTAMQTAVLERYKKREQWSAPNSKESCRIVVCDVTGPEPNKRHVVAQLPFYLRHIRGQTYILESLGSLFVVVRNGCQLRLPIDDFDRIPLTFIQQVENDENLIHGTLEFIVYRVDLAAGQGTQTRELGDRAFFLGASASLLVQASEFPGIKPNHIYFTDDFLESYMFYEEGGGLDMGVFNLADGSIQPHYEGVSLSPFCPPIWVTPTLS